MIETVLERNNTTLVPIPDEVVKEVGLHRGTRVEVTDDGYHIILTPLEEDFTDAEWEKLKKLAATKGKTYKTFKGVKKHLQSLKK